ncbi:MAG: hypothetical protein HY329_19155 [Chloroflexi bacterium]|nr:hypothetical protein [Chloroflexota bacterium]
MLRAFVRLLGRTAIILLALVVTGGFLALSRSSVAAAGGPGLPPLDRHGAIGTASASASQNPSRGFDAGATTSSATAPTNTGSTGAGTGAPSTSTRRPGGGGHAAFSPGRGLAQFGMNALITGGVIGVVAFGRTWARSRRQRPLASTVKRPA